MISSSNTTPRPWRTAWAVLIAAALTIPVAQAQKGMTKAEYLDYLVRSGQREAPSRALEGQPLFGASKTLGPADIKLNTLDIGNVRARIRNTGTLGYDRDGYCYEFPFNSGITYRWTLGPMIAGKKVVDGEVRKFVSGGALGAVRGTSEDEFRPLRGFDAGKFDAAQNLGFAFSDKPATWPTSWPTLDQMVASNGSYVMSQAAQPAFLNNPAFDPVSTGTARVGSLGFPGVINGETRAPREAYFVITDNDPAEPGKPIPMDVRVDVWGLQWDDFVNRNFIIYRLLFTNVGTTPITDVYVGIHDDPDAPSQGVNEWTDDFAYLIPPGKDDDGDGVPDADADPRADVDGDGFYTAEDSLLWNTIYVWDGDDKAEGFIANNVGWVGLKFLETPNDPATGRPRGITTLDIFRYDFAPTTDARAYDQMAGVLHVEIPADDPQQGGGTPIMLPQNVQPNPDDIFQIANSYGPDVTIVAASGPYTLNPGESLPFTFASVHGSSRADVLNNAKLTQILFDNDYRSASGPPIPHVVAVPGDGRVTLYWDDAAEKGIYPDGSFGDPLTGNNAFQGYKVYRSDDGGQTFGRAIVDIDGTTRGYIPLAVFDIPDGISGESDTRRYFGLGTDSGLQHKYVDTNVQNGKEYIYAVVAFDSQDGPVPPLETPINLADPNAPGDNTVLVRPMAKPAGIKPGVADAVARKIAGNADIQTQTVEVFDPNELVTGTYRVAIDFNDDGETVYSVARNGQAVSDMGGNTVEGVSLFDPDLDSAPVFNGVRVIVENVAYGVKSATQTTGSGLSSARVRLYRGSPANRASDYEIRFTEKMWTYSDWDNGIATLAPFEMFNLTTGKKVHGELIDDNGDGEWTPGEIMMIVATEYPQDEADAADWLGDWPGDYAFYWFTGEDATWEPGDVFRITTNKPLSPDDVFEFDVQGPEFDKAQLEEDLEEVTVVPNPFVVSSSYEKGAFGMARQLQFHQLPERCTIRIFTTAGELVQIIEHNGGSIAPWNLQTYNGQEVAFGVYLFIVQTPEGVEKTGKFAVIK